MPVTRINNNQISDSSAGNEYLGINAGVKLQDYSLTSGKIANNLTYGSDLTVAGNLTVQGNTTTIDTVNVVIEDPLILLADAQTGSPTLDIGYIGKRGTEDNIALVWDESADKFVAAFTDSEVTNTTINITSYASFSAGNLDTGGTLDVTGQTTLTGNLVTGNIIVDGEKTIDVGNSLISNVQYPVANTDAATKEYVDSQAASGFTIEDDTANTTTVSGGDTLQLLGTANEVTVEITDVDQITFGLPDDVTVFGNLDAGNVNATNDVTATTVTASGNVNANNAVITNDVSTTSVTASGNIDGANVNATTNVVATGNVEANNAVITNDVSTTSVTASGNVDANNFNASLLVTAGNVEATGNVDAGIAINTNAIYGNPLALYSTGDLSLIASGNILGNGTAINNIADPVQPQDAATKFYVDSIAEGLHIHASCEAATPANLATISGGTITYDNGTLGVGATLTTSGTYSTIDGISIAVANTRILVKDESNQAHNGIYIYSNSTVLTRAVDFNTAAEIQAGDYVFVNSGNIYGNTSWVQVDTVNTVGTDPIVWEQFGGAGTYTAGNGIVIVGTVITAKVDEISTSFDAGGNIVVKQGAVLVDPVLGNAVANSLAVAGNGLITATNIELSGNVLAGNVNSNAAVTGVTITASGNIEGNNAVITNDVSTSTVTASGNVDGANVNATTNVTSTTVTASGNVNANNAVITNDVSTTTVTASGNIDGANLNATTNVTGTTLSASGNVNANNAVITNDVSATTGTFSGNVDANNAVITNDVSAATGTFSTSVSGGNITISGDSIDGSNGIININGNAADTDFAVNGDTNANIFYIDAGTETASFGNATQTTGALVAFNSTDSVLLPIGNTAQRPSGVEGMFRYNTTDGAIEWYDGAEWQSATSDFTVIVDDSFNGDGSTTTFTLSQDSTTAGTIVTINGVVQIPTTAYSVTGNSLQFTEAPEVSDTIDARILTTTATVNSIEGAGGALFIAGSGEEFLVTGNLIPSANVTYDLGNTTNRWNELFLAGSTITLGNIVMKNVSGNTIGFFGPDGVTPATLDANTEIVGDSIESGTSNVSFAGAGGNVLLVAGGNTTGTVTSTGLVVTGSIEATGGFIGLDATQIQSGTSNVSVISSGGNVDVNVAGNPIVTFFSGGIDNRQANGVGNIGTATSYFNTVFAKATSAQYADLAEMYEADQNIEPGTVVCFGGAKEVMICDEDNCRRIAGVVSTNPSYIMNAGLAGDCVVAVALTGRVPTRVTGTIRKGDMLVAAGDGRARAEADPATGAVIGKALADFDGADGVIEVVVGRL